jgi:hypothetical protein
MIETVVTATITVSSILLFCYWFRYTCQLILSAATSRDYATNVARAHQLGFQQAQVQLSQDAPELDRLKSMLDRDYAVLTRLMDQATDAPAGIERHMLAIHYRLESMCYRATASVSASAASKALEQMSMVVAHFANSLGEAAAAPSAA